MRLQLCIINMVCCVCGEHGLLWTSLLRTWSDF